MNENPNKLFILINIGITKKYLRIIYSKQVQLLEFRSGNGQEKRAIADQLIFSKLITSNSQYNGTYDAKNNDP